METILTDKEAMSLAIQVAKEGAGWVSPNPLVGCVILSKNNELLGSGYHELYGGPHAEVNAIKNINPELLIDARVFVTLEPCAHHGQTPPCANMLAELPIGEVLYGIKDPNPLVSGKGAEIISCTKKKVSHFAELTNELEELCEVFLLNFRKNEIFVSLKVATSIDGMLGLKSGDSKWITNEKSRKQAHYLRAINDAVLVGATTIINDDPSLNIRHPKFKGKSNTVIILDPNGKILSRMPQLNICKTHKASEILVFTKQNLNLTSDHCQIFEVAYLSDEKLNLSIVLDKLWHLKIRSLLVEGGAHTLSEFITQRKAHRLFQFIAPQIIGGINGLAWSNNVKIDRLDDRIYLKNSKTEYFDQDILVTGIIEQPANSIQFSSAKNTNPKELRFYRSGDGWLFGVCQGLGESFELHPILIRLFGLIAFLYYGLGLGIYLALAISLPRKDKLDKVFKRQFLGVCGILSKKLDLEIGIVRFLTLLLTLITGGFAVLAYVILYFAYEEK
jgi:diaminohydroxyphosphoribosylaminopyrimidine deaminase/5-amino-6-(5-phosphoribosylamino)uracil reductase